MNAESKSFYASSCDSFLKEDTESILGKLTVRVSLIHQGDERAQVKAWERQIEILKTTLTVQQDISHWNIYIELPLQRISRRIDTIITIGDTICCIEFKIGAKNIGSGDILQAEDYALCLRDFHAGSLGADIYPILCAEKVKHHKVLALPKLLENVAPCIRTNKSTLQDTLQKIAATTTSSKVDWREFDQSAYNPTPNIVQAAQELFAGHSVKEIVRTDSNAEDLQTTFHCLRALTERARTQKEKIICFVTGEPGSGKTLLGLNLAFSSISSEAEGSPAALLSGNPPLVRVLQEAIAVDAAKRKGITKKAASQIAIQGLQNLLSFLKEHKDSPPPENIIIYDEAQRAWNAATGERLLNREASEPELFLEIMGRLPWACLVCLVGPGQEINRGEEGLPLWGKALASEKNRNQWNVVTSRQCLAESDKLPGLLAEISAKDLNVTVENNLHLKTNLRAYRNTAHGNWVASLLKGKIDEAARIATAMERPPAFVTRNLKIAKEWLEERIRGGHRAGLFNSAQAVRLLADGIPLSPRSNELDAVVNWFLKGSDDFRSSNSLERPLTEFVCQGLEIDYGGLCWGHDLIWKGSDWLPRKMRSPKWTNIPEGETRNHRINAYRVLLTRARAGLVIYVPEGSSTDPTRSKKEADETFKTLIKSGCHLLNKLEQ